MTSSPEIGAAPHTVSLDSDIEMFLAPPCSRRPYEEQDVGVRLSTEYNRKPLSDAEQERSLEAVWEARLRDNPRLWDGSKFRIQAARQEESSSRESDGTRAIMDLGVTGYKDYLTTNFSPRVSELQASGLRDHGDPHAHLSHPLGVGALVRTSDDMFVLQRRSQFCGEAVGMLDIPGGHPEPSELVGKQPVSEIDVSGLDERAVVHEVFDSIHREVCDEVNLAPDTVSFPVLLGIVRNTPSAGRPTAEFYCRCSLTSDQVRSLYEEGTQPEAEETTSIQFVPMAALPELDSSPNYSDLWRQLTASAKGAITLFRMTSLVDPYVTPKQ